MEIEKLGIKTIISDMSWFKGIHKHFIDIGGNINTLYLESVNINLYTK